MKSEHKLRLTRENNISDNFPECSEGEQKCSTEQCSENAHFAKTSANARTDIRPEDNIRTQVVDDVLTITIDLRVVGVPSKAGKSLLVANSRGFRPFIGANGCKLAVLVTRPLTGFHPEEARLP